MAKSRWLVVASICSLFALPAISTAQAPDTTKEQAQSVHDILRGLLSPNWNLFLHGGFTSGERFALQHAVNTLDGERALRSSTGFNVGAGGGVDILLRMGLRASYTFTSSNLNFKTDNGNGSDALDIDDVGRLKSSTVSVEVMRYMLPSSAGINPYGSFGVQGTWWSLDEKSPLVASNDATPFSGSLVFSFGVQVKATDNLSGRLEATLYGGHNPFTGNTSFRALSGPSIDEPTSIGRTDYRIAGVYHFGKPKPAAAPATVAKKK
jgi:hypothetical protein